MNRWECVWGRGCHTAIDASWDPTVTIKLQVSFQIQLAPSFSFYQDLVLHLPCSLFS